ncbi:160_t:CDS:2, partial [Paraglomus occultum]
MTTGLQSIADLTASTRITTGDIPPPLVGASMTVIGTKLYLFAGRLVSSRKMTNDLYILDLETFIWTKIVDNSETLPNGRYFHSANIHKKSIVFFGGMGYARNGGEELCVLDDVVIYNIETFTWHYPEIKPSHSAPKPRYAHLAAITANKLLVIGGQDMSNHYIEEINVLDLDEMTWTISRSFDKHCGAYRSIAVSSRNHTELPVFGNDMAESVPLSPYSSETASITSTPPAYASPRKMSAGTFNYSGPRRGQPANHIISRMQGIENSYCRLSYSTSVTDDNPNPVYIYSNYNFTDVKRELQVVAPPTTSNFQIMDHSTSMTGAFLPPGLRFPTGYILGHYLIISGTYLTNASQTFSVWALNLANLVWTRIDTGSTFTHGSWNRGVLCEVTNKYIVLGNRDRALVEDYNHRQTNFDHVAIIDLEAFGVYQPPPATMSPSAQELGLALISEPNMADYEIVTIDGYRIPVNSMMLSARWPHFRALAEAQANRVPEVKYDSVSKKGEEEATITMYNYRALEFPEPYAVAIAFIQYLYTDNLLTLQQHQPAILAQLLLLADMYDLERLRQLASHALHQNLNMSTAALIYETAALSKQSGLQIRALK